MTKALIPSNRILRLLVLVLPLVLLLPPSVSGQQTYVSRYDAYAGYAFLNSPHIGLFENGVHFQGGVRPKTWFSLGVDYSYTKGDLTLTPDLLPDALQQQLAAQFAYMGAHGLLPAGYVLQVPAHSTTHSLAMGPQLSYRHFKHVTLFIRPSLGAIREIATPAPKDAIATAVVQSLAPAGVKRDWQGFYGVGGGMDFLFSKHVALRVQSDFVYDHLFNDILKDGRWTTRFSIGPAFNFGRNIAE